MRQSPSSLEVGRFLVNAWEVVCKECYLGNLRRNDRRSYNSLNNVKRIAISYFFVLLDWKRNENLNSHGIRLNQIILFRMVIDRFWP